MGTCVSRQTRPDGKPEEEREQPETYSNSAPYFIAQLIALITHETYEISPAVTETLLLTHIFYCDSITLLTAIRDRFFMTFERYKFITYKRESDICVTYNPNRKNKKDIHSNLPMKRLPIPSTPPCTPPTPHHQIQLSRSISTSMNNTPSPSPQTPNNKYKYHKYNSNNHKNNISDEFEIKEFPNTSNTTNKRLRSGTIDIGYLPTKQLQYMDWIIDVKIVIQKKCLDLLLKWIENYWIEDFDENENNHKEIMDMLTEFIDDIKKSRDQFQNLMNNHNKKKKKKKKKKNNLSNSQNEKSHHKIYASFIQSYILKLDNIIATQQIWYKPIVKELRDKQEMAAKLYNEQIRNSKRFRHNRLNSTANNTNKSNNNHHRSSTNSVSAFSDNIFGDNLLERLYDDTGNEEDEYEHGHDIDEKSQQFISPTLTVQSIKSRKSVSKSNTYSTVMDDTCRRISTVSMASNEDSNNTLSYANMGNTLSFIAMKNQENAREYAKQLTLLDWELFLNIEPRNCLYKIIKKNKKKTLKENKWLSVKLFIDRFQQSHQYVIVSIIAAPDLKARIEMIEFFIFVCEALLQLNNLYSFMAVVTALDSVSISKLKVSWQFVNKSFTRKFKEYLSPLCSAGNNYKLLRDYAKQMKAPSIPFLGLILKDLTFTNDGNKNKLNRNLDKHINFKKYMLFYRILSENISKHKIKTYSKKIKHSKQFETQDINALVSQLNIDDYKEEEEEELDMDIEINIIPDSDLQSKILKDLNSYILLNKNVIRAMTSEANRIDLLKKDGYIQHYLSAEKNNKKRNSFSKSRRKKSSHFKSGSFEANSKKPKLSLMKLFRSQSDKKNDDKLKE